MLLKRSPILTIKVCIFIFSFSFLYLQSKDRFTIYLASPYVDFLIILPIQPANRLRIITKMSNTTAVAAASSGYTDVLVFIKLCSAARGERTKGAEGECECEYECKNFFHFLKSPFLCFAPSLYLLICPSNHHV